jgi:hypothetical protein
MMKTTVGLSLLVALFATTGCGGSASTGGNGGSGTSTGTATGSSGSSTGSSGQATGSSGAGTGASGSNACGTNVIANAANDYAFMSTLTFPPVSVKPMSDLTFDWSALTTDFVGHAVNVQTDISMANVFMWTLTLPELETQLNADSLKQQDLTVLPLTYFTTTDAGVATSADLFSFTLSGNPVTSSDILPYFDSTMYDPSKYTYTLIVASGTMLGQGARMIQSFQLDPNSTNTKVTLTDSSTTLQYTADLHDLQPTMIPAGTAAVQLDWGMMTTNALGNPFVTTNITNALVAHYTQTPAQLESQFLNLELIATDLYQNPIPSGTVVDFSMLQDSAGKSFTGIDSTGTWIVALQCGSCRNPAPWYLSILKPCN